jgi:polyisoprenoid-binding protein YceI
VSARGKINRKDFGLNWNVALETGGWLVGDTISIDIEVEAVKQTEEQS